ncbi:MAG: hypothetical protein JSW58_07260 [Candidatus Latescibacterota bacterium]|nr:MAG: hypothetical protein JSW58_07260 [Candidatus Latescibacterota bacterium]
MTLLRKVTWSVPLLVGIFVVALSAGWPSEAGAQVILADPALPPESDPPDCDNLISLYMAEGLAAEFPGPVKMCTPRHRCFTNVFRQQMGNDEVETFDSILDTKVDMGLGSVWVTLTGPVTTRVYNKWGNTTGLFDAEIVSMSLSGSVGGYDIAVQESPALASLGQTDIVDLGGGLYHIDSFFDVFVELSVDGGPWMPQLNPAAHMVLIPLETVPAQPTTWGAIKALYD